MLRLDLGPARGPARPRAAPGGTGRPATRAGWSAAGARRAATRPPSARERHRHSRTRSYDALAQQLLDELASTLSPLRALEPTSLPDNQHSSSPRPARPALEDKDAGARGSAPRNPRPKRLHASWLGRAVGCLLGKPVEKLPLRRHPGHREVHVQLAPEHLVHAPEPPAGRGGALPLEPPLRAPPPSPRTSTACRRTTTSTTRSSACSCSSATAPTSPPRTWRSSGWTSCRRAARSPRSASRTAISSTASSPRTRPCTTTRSGSGSAPRSARTSSAGRTPATPPGQPNWRTGTRR